LAKPASLRTRIRTVGPLDFIARNCPDYLQWMLGQDFFDDAKAVVRHALRRCAIRVER
jgi:hypothetical protein